MALRNAGNAVYFCGDLVASHFLHSCSVAAAIWLRIPFLVGSTTAPPREQWAIHIPSDFSGLLNLNSIGGVVDIFQGLEPFIGVWGMGVFREQGNPCCPMENLGSLARPKFVSQPVPFNRKV